MDIGWLEDYIALRETGSFTAAAERRNASQPAFSRRIQALEAWLGVSLVDRTRRPPSFTPLALENDAEIRNLLNHFHDLRGRLRGEQQRSSKVRVAVQHSLALSLIPTIMETTRSRDSHPVYWLQCDDRTSCIEMMFRGEADLLICYETAKIPAAIPSTLASRRVLGRDAMVLVGRTSMFDRDGAWFAEGQRLPLLTYPQSNFFGQIIWDQIMPALSAAFDVEAICISGFSGALKQMALAGMGLAWLPKSLVENELRDDTVRIFHHDRYMCSLDIAIYTRTSNVSAAQALAWDALFEEEAYTMHPVHE